MARNIFAPLEGLPVALSDVIGPFRPCRKCGGGHATITTVPQGIHLGGVVCACGSSSYLSREALAAMLAVQRAGVGVC